MLVIAVFAHAITSRLMTKVDKYPLRLLVVRILEVSGKIFVIPFVLLYFLLTFTSYGTAASRDFTFLCIGCFGLLLSAREFRGLLTDIKDAMKRIRGKVDNPAVHTLTWIEIITFNLYMFGKFSRSPVHYHRWKREINKDVAMTGTSKSFTAGQRGDVELQSIANPIGSVGTSAASFPEVPRASISGDFVDGGSLNYLPQYSTTSRDSDFHEL